MKDRTIFLVEDNAGDRQLLLIALKRNGVDSRVVVARDGAEAMDLLFGPEAGRLPPGQGGLAGEPRSFLRPDLIILDLKMPRIDGLELLQKIRAHGSTKTTPVVVLSSSMDDKDIHRSYSLGANGYVRKPVNFEQFSDAIRRLAQYWLDLNETAPAPVPGHDGLGLIPFDLEGNRC